MTTMAIKTMTMSSATTTTGITMAIAKSLREVTPSVGLSAVETQVSHNYQQHLYSQLACIASLALQHLCAESIMVRLE